MRGRREGSVYRRQDGRWVASLWTEEGGRPKRRDYYASSQQEALDVLAAKREDVRKGLPLPAERATLGPLLDEWLAGVEVRPQTKASYAGIVARHLKPDLGSTRLTALTAPRIECFLAAKSASGLAAGTVRHIRVVLVMALEYAARHNIVGRNEARLARGPKKGNFEANPLSLEENGKFIEALRGHRFEALFATMAVLGLRLGEALALRWCDVALDDGGAYLMVQHTLVRLKGGPPMLAPTKTKTSRRKLTIPARLVEILRRHRVRQIEERLAAGPGWQALDFVFASSRGTPLDHANVYKALQAVLLRAGLRRVRNHDLRHGVGTAGFLDGIDPKRLSVAMGHSCVATTLDMYVHVAEALDDQGAKRLEALLLGTREQPQTTAGDVAAVKTAVN